MLTVDDACELLRTQLGGKLRGNLGLGGDTRLEDLGLSSLQIAEVVFGLEDKLGIEFDPVDAAEVTTIGGLVDLANSLVQDPVGG